MRPPYPTRCPARSAPYKKERQYDGWTLCGLWSPDAEPGRVPVHSGVPGMRGLLRIGRSLALRHLPRLGAPDGSRGFVPLPGFCGRPAGGGPGAGIASGVFAMPLETSFLCRWLSALGCRQATVPARGVVTSPRPASRVQRRDPSRRLPKAPGAAFSRTALRALPSALVGVQPTTVPGVSSRDAGKAAASSRLALPSRRASVVTSAKRTVKRSERASDDAVRRCLHVEETRLVRGFSPFGDQGPKSADKCREVEKQFFSPPGKKVVRRSPSLFAGRNRMPC